MSVHPTRPFQFTLRSIFVLTTLTAIFLSAYFAGPEWAKLVSLVFAMAILPVTKSSPSATPADTPDECVS